MEIARYGTASGLRLRSDDRTGAFAWDSDADPARRRLRITTDCCPATAAVRTSPSAPSHPQNERRLVAQLIACLGRRIASGLYTPVPLSDLLPPARGAKFLSQRLDLLLAFSNGCCPVLEPGDRTKGDSPVAQHERDCRRAPQGWRTRVPHPDRPALGGPAAQEPPAPALHARCAPGALDRCEQVLHGAAVLFTLIRATGTPR